jgi:hypothetical protein
LLAVEQRLGDGGADGARRIDPVDFGPVYCSPALAVMDTFGR